MCSAAIVMRAIFAQNSRTNAKKLKISKREIEREKERERARERERER